MSIRKWFFLLKASLSKVMVNNIDKYQYIKLMLFLCSVGGQTSAVGRTLRPRARMAAVRAEVTEAGTMASSWGRATCPPTAPRTCRGAARCPRHS